MRRKTTEGTMSVGRKKGKRDGSVNQTEGTPQVINDLPSLLISQAMDTGYVYAHCKDA